jgi:hypothetical protein
MASLVFKNLGFTNVMTTVKRYWVFDHPILILESATDADTDIY